MVQIEERHRKELAEILAQFDVTFCAFGSRVKGEHRPLSDLDLAVMDPLPGGMRSCIEEAFEESNLPFKVDVVVYSELTPAFRDQIRADLELLHPSSTHVPHPDIAYPMLLNGEVYKNTVFLKNILKNRTGILVGDYTYYHDRDNVYNFEKNVRYHHTEAKLRIGRFCSIASGCTFVMDGADHPFCGISAYPFKTFSNNSDFSPYVLSAPKKSPWDVPMQTKLKGDTVVGNDVWIGCNATIMPGVHIGDGAIVGTNSTVTKDVEPYSIVGGNPARVIRKRFDDATITKLLALRWWDWPIEKINLHVEDIALDIHGSRLL